MFTKEWQNHGDFFKVLQKATSFLGGILVEHLFWHSFVSGMQSVRPSAATCHVSMEVPQTLGRKSSFFSEPSRKRRLLKMSLKCASWNLVILWCSFLKPPENFLLQSNSNINFTLYNKFFKHVIIPLIFFICCLLFPLLQKAFVDFLMTLHLQWPSFLCIML